MAGSNWKIGRNNCEPGKQIYEFLLVILHTLTYFALPISASWGLCGFHWPNQKMGKEKLTDYWQTWATITSGSHFISASVWAALHLPPAHCSYLFSILLPFQLLVQTYNGSKYIKQLSISTFT